MPATIEHSAAIQCLGCHYPLPLAEVTGPEGARCPRCQARQHGRAFPAAFAVAGPAPIPPPAQSGEATCFQHATKRADAACDQCGRFLCSLCGFPLGVQVLCPLCVDAARTKQTTRWIGRRLNLDSVALTTAMVPMLGVWTTLVGAPVALYLGIRALYQPAGPVPRGRWRAVLAIVLAGVQVILWAALFLTLFGTALYRGGRLG